MIYCLFLKIFQLNPLINFLSLLVFLAKHLMNEEIKVKTCILKFWNSNKSLKRVDDQDPFVSLLDSIFSDIEDQI